MKKNFFAKRLLEFELGRYFGPTLLQFFFVLATFIKVYFDATLSLVIVLTIGSVILIWIMGYIMLNSGFYEKYQREIPVFRKILEEAEKEERK